MSKTENRNTAQLGEAAAAEYLRHQGYEILVRNYRTRLGEIDIIARSKDCICFIEVKARFSPLCGSPLEAVDAAKQRKICRVALGYLREKKLQDCKARFDVVAVVLNEGKTEVRLIPNAFELDDLYS
jgi:putative endonuclease